MMTSDTSLASIVARLRASRMTTVPSSLPLKDESLPQNDPARTQQEKRQITHVKSDIGLRNGYTPMGVLTALTMNTSGMGLMMAVTIRKNTFKLQTFCHHRLLEGRRGTHCRCNR